MTSKAIDLHEIELMVAETGRGRRALIPLLMRINRRWKYLPREVLDYLPEITELTPAQISGVATFYSRFRLTPAGSHTVQVCIGTACHVKGADDVFQAFRKYLAIPENSDTDQAGLFTVEKVACLGCCMLAPAVRIDNVIYGRVEPDKTGNILKDFLSSQQVVVQALQPAKGKVSGEVRICNCSSCAASGSTAVLAELKRMAAKLGLPVKVREVGCTGMSFRTPLLEVADGVSGKSFYYAAVKPDAVSGILLAHFRPAGISRKLTAEAMKFAAKIVGCNFDEIVCRYAEPELGNLCNCGDEEGQKRIVTSYAGELDPLDISQYLDFNGFDALKSAILTSPVSIIEIIKCSGLRGRGGGGYPTGLKWQQVAGVAAEKKYLVCNADEGDPGAFMDRMLLESFPYRVIEGIVIAAYAAGITHGFIYVREEYQLAVERIQLAVERCRERGLLGSNILGSGLTFDLEVVEGAGAFVCGEETALIASLEGRRGMPSLRPPYPAESGFEGFPTLVNNVETFASIPWIVANGAESFSSYGTSRSRGTKTFALAGKIKRGGLIEVPMGMTIREIVEKIGGGVPDGTFKAVQMGGPSGGCIPASLGDTPVDYEALKKLDAIMGSGGMVVLDQSDCMVDIARYFLSFTRRESCGKCTFCRVGTVQMLEILERLCGGKGVKEDIEELERLAGMIKLGSICGLGRTAPNPVLSTLRFFRDEYEAHIAGKCPAGKCRNLIKFEINNDCIGCTVCAQNCAVDAIEFKPYRKQRINQEKCVKCGVCRKLCPQHAVEVH